MERSLGQLLSGKHVQSKRNQLFSVTSLYCLIESRYCQARANGTLLTTISTSIGGEEKRNVPVTIHAFVPHCSHEIDVQWQPS